MSSNGHSGRKTPLGDFYRSTVRPDLRSRFSQSYLDQHEATVTAVNNWRRSTFVEDIDSDWLADFQSHLKAAGKPSGWTTILLRNVKRIVRRKYPNRFSAHSPWDQQVPMFQAEPTGHLGNYYVSVFEPNQTFGPQTRRHYRNAVRRYYQWPDRRVVLDQIDEAQVDKFEAAECKRTSRRTAQYGREHIARIVNHFKPGRIRNRSLQEPPKPAAEGTVQAFVEAAVIPAASYSKRHLRNVRKVMQRVLVFNDGKPIAFSQFTEDFAESYLRWAFAAGKGGKPLSVWVINSVDRWILNTISHEAVSRGLMRRPLRLEKVANPKRPTRRKRLAGYQCETNGQAKKRPAAKPAEDQAPPPVPKKPHWDATTRTLTFGPHSRTYAPQAKKITTLFPKFEEHGWPEKIASPCPEDIAGHKEAIDALNTCGFLKFSSVRGVEIAWKPC